jgi:hypothetical protein
MASNAPDGTGDDALTDAPRPSRTRLIIALALLAFVIGLAAMTWVVTNWQGGLRFGTLDPAAMPSGPATMLNSADGADPTQGMPDARGSTRGASEVLNAATQVDQVAALEQRLTRVAVAAEAASGYANRAEAMMIAFAARRALDTGTSLGYVEAQLRLLFGEAQPKAVATIVNAAEKPVTLGTLRAGLVTIGTAIERGSPNEGWWSAAMRELRGLAVIRQADAPSPEPRERLARARLNVESGQIEAAIGEVSSLSRQPEMTQWLEQARRYNEARRALDVIEAAAILEPRTAPVVTPVAQPAPATPARP